MRIKAWLDRQFEGTVSSLIASAIIACCIAGLPIVSAYVLAATQQTWPIALTVSLAMLGSILVIIAQLRQDRRRQPLSDQEIENIIRNWLIEMRYSVQKQEDKDAYFFYRVIDFADRPLVIARHKKSPSFISIISRPKIGGDFKIKLNSLSSGEREKLLFELRLEVLRFGIAYEMPPELDYVFFEEMVFFDRNISAFEFFNKVGFVVRGVGVFFHTLTLKLEMYNRVA